MHILACKRMFHDQCSISFSLVSHGCLPEMSLVVLGAGLQPDHGRRRSVRERHRPLEYWRNEKKVYTRQYRSALPHSSFVILDKSCIVVSMSLPSVILTSKAMPITGLKAL